LRAAAGALIATIALSAALPDVAFAAPRDRDDKRDKRDSGPAVKVIITPPVAPAPPKPPAPPPPPKPAPKPAPAPVRRGEPAVSVRVAPAPVRQRPAPPPVQRHPRYGNMNRPHWNGSIWLTPPRIVLRTGVPAVWFDLAVPFAYIRVGNGWQRVEGDLVRWYDDGGVRRYRVYGSDGWYAPGEIRFEAPTPANTPLVWGDGWSAAFWSGAGWISISPGSIRVNPRGGWLVLQGDRWVGVPDEYVRRRPAPPPPPPPADYRRSAPTPPRHSAPPPPRRHGW
jgi:hypothetical protein